MTDCPTKVLHIDSLLFNSYTWLPNLVEKIFEKYERILADDRENFGVSLCNTPSCKKFFIELEVIFGDVLLRALRLLDEQTITIYHPQSKHTEFAEITDGRRRLRALKLFPNVNFCPCEFFAEHVLLKEVSSSSTAVSSRKRLVNEPLRQRRYYTCEHVLCLRLAKMLRAPSLREESRMQHSKRLYDKGVIKDLKMLTQSQYSNYKFVGGLDNIKTFYAGIKAINFGEHGSFQINEDGFRVTVEDGKSVQASLFITTSCFSDYHVDGIVNFGLNMNVISECLGIFTGIDCSMRMIYKGQGTPLIMVLQPHGEDDVSTECSIKTTHHEELINFSLAESSPSLNVVFIRGHDFANILNEIDKSADELSIRLSPRLPNFRIDTLGIMQSEASVEVAKTSDMIMLFNCRDTTTARYKSSQIRQTTKALAAASKVAMKTDASGLLEMHFMIQSEEQAEVYVQFYITPQVDVAE